MQLFNGNFFTIDSLPSVKGEEILFRVSEKQPAGNLKAILGTSVYARYTKGQSTAVDILFNKENVEIELDFNNPHNTLNIIQSKENKLLYDYVRKDARIVQKLGLLEQLTSQYPDRDELYRTALEFFKKFQQERNQLIDSIYLANKNSLAARIIQTLKMPFAEGDVTAAQRDSLFKGHFLDPVSFADTTLLYTSAYTDKLFRYLQHFAAQQQSPRQNEAELMKHLDHLMERISENEYVRNHLLNFIIDGLENMQYEEALNYLSTNYLQQCDGPLELTKRRLEGYQKMAVGEKVPDFFSIDTAQVAYNLYADLSPYTLVIFWHSECGYCRNLLRELPVLIEEGAFAAHGVKLVTVSIDAERESWKEFSRHFPMPWINTFIPGGFESETAADFNLYATPTMFLLDAEHRIVSKPQILEDIRSDLEKLN